MSITTKSSHLFTLLVGALAFAGCPEPTNNTDVQGSDATDTGNTTDTGGGSDVVDTGSPMDVQGTDATADDVQSTDSGPADTGPADTGPADTGPTTTPLNGCASFTDLSAPTATRTITFAGTAYTPNCIEIGAGQMVTFSGPFTLHPLRAGQAPSRSTMPDSPSTTPTPIVDTDTGTSANFTFSAAGDYGFYCNFHQSVGMYGVIRVH